MSDWRWEATREIMGAFGLGTAAHRVKAEQVYQIIAAHAQAGSATVSEGEASGLNAQERSAEDKILKLDPPAAVQPDPRQFGWYRRWCPNGHMHESGFRMPR